MSVPAALSCLRLVLQSLVTSFLLLVLCWTSLTVPFLSAGTRYQSGLLFLNFMWGVVFTACVAFLFSFNIMVYMYGVYVWCIYGIFGRKITNYTIVYGV